MITQIPINDWQELYNDETQLSYPASEYDAILAQRPITTYAVHQHAPIMETHEDYNGHLWNVEKDLHTKRFIAARYKDRSLKAYDKQFKTQDEWFEFQKQYITLPVPEPIVNCYW